MISRFRTGLAKWWSDGEKRWLLVILVVGALLRLAMALYLGDKVELIPVAYDQIHFDNVAHSLLAGRGFSFTRPPWPFIEAGAPTAYVSFLYTLFLAGVYGVFGPHALVVRIIQALVCSLMPWQVYLLVKRIWPMADGRWPQSVADSRWPMAEAVALVAAAITASYAYFVFYSATLMTEGFYLVTVVWALSLTLDLAKAPSAPRWASWGLAVSLASLLRQVFMPLAALLFLYILWQARRRVKISHVVLAGGIAALLILPWTVRNYLAFDRFLLLNSQAGQVFWNANHPDMGADFDSIAMFPIPAELEGLNEAELDSALLRLGLQNVAADPGRFVRLSLSRLAAFFRFWPIPSASTFNNVARTVSFTI